MFSTNQKSLVFRINIFQKHSSVQPLLLNLWILCQDFAHVSDNTLQGKSKTNQLITDEKSNKNPMAAKKATIIRMKG